MGIGEWEAKHEANAKGQINEAVISRVLLCNHIPTCMENGRQNHHEECEKRHRIMADRCIGTGRATSVKYTFGYCILEKMVDLESNDLLTINMEISNDCGTLKYG